jgi:hypothetical protein
MKHFGCLPIRRLKLERVMIVLRVCLAVTEPLAMLLGETVGRRGVHPRRFDPGLVGQLWAFW